jgi:phosphatidylinositol glycan class Z
LVGFGSFFTAIAILTDTIFYQSSPFTFRDAIRHPVITPLNNLLYNSNTDNLAAHGIHPHYQHFLVNLPQLLGPALVVLTLGTLRRFGGISVNLNNRRAISAVSGTMILSIFPHQEPRFLLPCVPLLLTCIRPLRSRPFLAIWVVFNIALGFLMGVYHQGGVVPTQLAIPSIVSSSLPARPDGLLDSLASSNATVFWWKTYSPPLWLLGDNSGPSSSVHIKTRDLMGIRGPEMIQEVDTAVPPCSSAPTSNAVFLVAPHSATFLDPYTHPSSADDRDNSPIPPLRLRERWTYKNHLNLDDLDFGDDGVLATLYRVIGRRGLIVWSVDRVC